MTSSRTFTDTMSTPSGFLSKGQSVSNPIYNPDSHNEEAVQALYGNPLPADAGSPMYDNNSTSVPTYAPPELPGFAAYESINERDATYHKPMPAEGNA